MLMQNLIVLINSLKCANIYNLRGVLALDMTTDTESLHMIFSVVCHKAR